jgi:hypothetical protein
MAKVLSIVLAIAKVERMVAAGAIVMVALAADCLVLCTKKSFGGLGCITIASWWNLVDGSARRMQRCVL